MWSWGALERCEASSSRIQPGQSVVREEFEVLYFLGLGNIRGQKVGEFQKGRRIGPHDI